MDNEIKANDFVRTKKYGIFKVKEIRETPYKYLCGTTDSEKLPTFTIGKGGITEIKNDIVKYSRNLIDLVGVGDYVNGEQITDICNDDRISSIKSNFSEEDIENIVTKEQFESISYKVERKG